MASEFQQGPAQNFASGTESSTTAAGAQKVIDTRSGLPHIAKELLESCIHCGLCLPACPTYLATGREMESPRGRIQLLSSLQKGEFIDEPRLLEHIDSCLGCFGCQTACP